MSHNHDNDVEAVRDHFNDMAERYAQSASHRSSESINILKNWAADGRYELGIDIASGPGFVAYAVAEYCDTVVVSDIAEKMLDEARKLAKERAISNVRFEIVDAHDIDYPDASFDLVTCRTAAHHFYDVEKFLSEVHRILKPSGVFLFCDTTTSEDPELARWHQRVEAVRDTSHANAPPPSAWTRNIGDAGFEVADTASATVDMVFWNWVERSGTSEEDAKGLHRDFAQASDEVKREYRITATDDDDFEFSWPVYTCRAVKI